MIVDDHRGGRHHMCWFEMEVTRGDHCVGLHFYWSGTVQVGQLAEASLFERFVW